MDIDSHSGNKYAYKHNQVLSLIRQETLQTEPAIFTVNSINISHCHFSHSSISLSHILTLKISLFLLYDHTSF